MRFKEQVSHTLVFLVSNNGMYANLARWIWTLTAALRMTLQVAHSTPQIGLWRGQTTSWVALTTLWPGHERFWHNHTEKSSDPVGSCQHALLMVLYGHIHFTPSAPSSRPAVARWLALQCSLIPPPFPSDLDWVVYGHYQQALAILLAMGAYGIKINFSQRLQFLEGRDFLGAVEIEPVADANRYQSRLIISWENVLLRNPFNKSKQISF